MLQMFEAVGFVPRPYAVRFDDETHEGRIHYKNFGFYALSIRTFFEALGVSSVLSIDISNYEGAEILLNLNHPCPSGYYGACEFIAGGSVLDNMFDAATYLRNMTKLLKPGGRLFEVNIMANGTRPYTYLLPPWYFDFFVINRYSDIKLYACLLNVNRMEVYKPILPEAGTPIKSNFLVQNFRPDPALTTSMMLIAEKGEDTDWEYSPTQDAYRAGKEAARYNPSAKRILGHPRPYVQLFREGHEGQFESVPTPPEVKDYIYIGHLNSPKER